MASHSSGPGPGKGKRTSTKNPARNPARPLPPLTDPSTKTPIQPKHPANPPALSPHISTNQKSAHKLPPLAPTPPSRNSSPKPQTVFFKATSELRPNLSQSMESLGTDSNPSRPGSPDLPKTPITNRVLIHNHVAGANNPAFLFRVLSQHRLRMAPPTNFFSHKTQTTTLVFSSTEDALAFTQTVPLSTFGPTSSYQFADRNPKPNRNPESRPPRLSVVVRGVHTEIREEELVAAANPRGSCTHRLDSAVRILGREGARTGLVRLFTTCQDCVALLLAEGLTVWGRTYRVEPSREKVLHRPCAKCHSFDHATALCPQSRPRCRKCGQKSDPNLKCPCPGLDPAKPFCATCMAYGHFTGQRQCPKYPHEKYHNPAPLPTTFAPSTPKSAPVSNPWKMKLQDFPAIVPPTPLPVSTPELQPASSSEAQQASSASTEPPTSESKAHADCVSISQFQSFMDTLLKVISEGFKQTFDALSTIIISSVRPSQQDEVQRAVNRVTKRAFDMRTVFQTVGSSLKVIHSDTRR